MAYPLFATPADMNSHLVDTTKQTKLIRNFIGAITNMDESVLVVETELFPRDSLTFYTRYNLDILDIANNAEDKQVYEKYYNPARGGNQGDYRNNIHNKINNVVDCLTKFPASKRAVLTIPDRNVDHTIDNDAKCLRELHFYLESTPSSSSSSSSNTSADNSSSSISNGSTGTENVLYLSCTGFMRAQAATIFPKNIHFIGK
jgi:hypothetical protein